MNGPPPCETYARHEGRRVACRNPMAWHELVRGAALRARIAAPDANGEPDSDDEAVLVCVKYQLWCTVYVVWSSPRSNPPTDLQVIAQIWFCCYFRHEKKKNVLLQTIKSPLDHMSTCKHILEMSISNNTHYIRGGYKGGRCYGCWSPIGTKFYLIFNFFFFK